MSALTVSAADEKRVKGMGFLNNKGTDNFNGRIITVNGKITAAQQKCIAEAAEKFGNGEVVFTTRLTVEVPGIPYDKIEEFQQFIAKEGLVTGGTGSRVRPVVSCKGTTCQYGLLDSYALSQEIHERFYEGFDEDSCNGCKKCAIEKNCPVGAAKVVDGILEIDKDVCNNCGRCVEKCPFDAIEDGTYGYKIYIGGRWGKKVAQGRALGRIFTDKEEAMSVIEKTILLFREQGKTGERLAQTIDRLGFENVEAQLLSDDILARKDEILAAELHTKGGATC